MTTYTYQTSKVDIANKTISVVLATPNFTKDKRKEEKTSIEHRLYDVFSKYLTVKH